MRSAAALSLLAFALTACPHGGEGEGEGEGEGDAGEGEGEGDAGEGEGEGEGEGDLGADAFAPGPAAVDVVEETPAGLPATTVFTSSTCAAAPCPGVLFLHGFQMDAHDYSEVLGQLASWGFVVAAPQLAAPLSLPASTEEDATTGLALMAWLAARPDVDAAHLGLAGHSRGGKVALRMLDADAALVGAVFLVDPVDGTGGPLGGDTRVVDGPFGYQASTAVLGTGLGPTCTGLFCQPCAPEGDNHDVIYPQVPAPATHIVVPDYGHADMLDDTCGTLCNICEHADSRVPMRELVGGLLAAHFLGTLGDGATTLAAALASAPLDVETESR